MTTKPREFDPIHDPSYLRCDCESVFCDREPAPGHQPGKCMGLGLYRVSAFGMVQRLCGECLQIGREHFPDDIKVLQ